MRNDVLLNEVIPFYSFDAPTHEANRVDGSFGRQNMRAYPAGLITDQDATHN